MACPVDRDRKGIWISQDRPIFLDRLVPSPFPDPLFGRYRIVWGTSTWGEDLDVLAVLDAVGISSANALVEREITTDPGYRKLIVEVPGHGRLFIGSLNQYWPSRENVEQALPRLNQINSRLQRDSSFVQVGLYHRAPDGQFVVWHAGYHCFVTEAFDGRSADVDRDHVRLARALGAFQRASAAEARTDQSSHVRPTLVNWTIPTLQSAHQRGWFDPDDNLPTVLDILQWLERERADAIDTLPTILTHGDFQAKNVLIG